MVTVAQLVVLLLAVVLCPVPGDGARILVVLPVLSHSHFQVARPLLHALSSRGHDVVVVSRHPHGGTANYTDVAVTQNSSPIRGSIPFSKIEYIAGPVTNSFTVMYAGLADCEDVLGEPAVQRMVRPDSGQHFDLLILELFHTDCFLALAHRFRAPVVSLSSSSLMPWAYARFGCPANPAFVPNLFLGLTDEMDFLSRLHNAVLLAAQRAVRAWYFDMRDQQVADRLLGERLGADQPRLPRLADIARNTSLLLVNTYHALSLPRPLPPNVIEIGGIHITEQPKALPEVPVVAITASTVMPWANARFGNPDNPAYIPFMYTDFTDEMTLPQRVLNTLHLTYVNVVKRLVFDPKDQLTLERVLGPGVPDVRALARNTSLLLVNSFNALSLPRPFANNVIEVGGIHIQENKALPKDLEQFVSGAKDGVVVFSLGSMIRTSSLPREHGAALLQAFGTLKQRVLWKWEDEAPGPVPKNVRLLKWMPQFDALCHNNTRLFIGHGGLLSTSEAAHCGVPLLGIAMYGDQRLNLAAISKSGAARGLPYSTLKNADQFIKHVRDMLDDPSYRENAKVLSARYRDRPMSPLETAVYWTEYVIRHKGAPHLRGAARNLAWWQEALLDVFAVLALGLAALLYALWTVLKTLARLVRSLGGSCDQKQAKKKKA